MKLACVWLIGAMLTSLKRVFGGESGIMEWGFASSGELFDERGTRRATGAEP